MLCGDLNGKEIPKGGDMCIHMAFQVALVVKNPPASAEDIKDMGLIPGSGRSPEENMATHSSILAWRIA